MRVDLSEKQAALLREYYTTVKAAEGRFNIVLSGVLADHAPCEVEGIELGESPHVTLKDKAEE